MKLFDNEMGGKTTSLVSGDELSSLSDELILSLAPELIRMFQDPMGSLGKVIEKAAPGNFKRYLAQLVESDNWELLIVDPNLPYPEIISGISFQNNVGTAAIWHPQANLNYQGKQLDVFSYLGWLNWGGLGFSGQVSGEESWLDFKELGFDCTHPAFEGTGTQVFATTPGGDVMVCNPDGICGFVSHESGGAYEIGKLSDAIDWIFECLSNGSPPEFDSTRLGTDT